MVALSLRGTGELLGGWPWFCSLDGAALSPCWEHCPEHAESQGMSLGLPAVLKLVLF